jgi:anaerobic magnesium-protoporphyrin IX monomethyl ester cyclase
VYWTEAARKCRNARIRITYNLIFGYPGETEADRGVTLRVMSEISDRFVNVSFSPNIFTPYPGIPVWPELRMLGMKEPQSLADWGEIDLKGNVLPWLGGEPYARVKRGMAYLLLKN